MKRTPKDFWGSFQNREVAFYGVFILTNIFYCIEKKFYNFVANRGANHSDGQEFLP